MTIIQMHIIFSIIIIVIILYTLLIMLLFNMNKKLKDLTKLVHIQWKQNYLNQIRYENGFYLNSELKYYKNNINDQFIYEQEDIEYIMKKINSNNYQTINLTKSKITLNFLTQCKILNLKGNKTYENKYYLFKFIDKNKNYYKLETLLDEDKRFVFINFEKIEN